MLNNHFKTQPHKKTTHNHQTYTDRFINMICVYVFFSDSIIILDFGAIRKFFMPLFIWIFNVCLGVFFCCCFCLTFIQSHFVNTQSFVFLCFNCEPIFAHILSIEHSTTLCTLCVSFFVVGVLKVFAWKCELKCGVKHWLAKATQMQQ